MRSKSLPTTDYRLPSFQQTGQSLIEVIVASVVGILVVTALVFATIFSLRNAHFAKNSAQATKLAQEGIERVRVERDRGALIGGNFFIASGKKVESWQDPNLWGYSISDNCNPCYFKFTSSSFQHLTGGGNMPSNPEYPLGDNKFKRVVVLSDDADYATQKTVTVIVQWTDFAGPHESKLTTILRKL